MIANIFFHNTSLFFTQYLIILLLSKGMGGLGTYVVAFVIVIEYSGLKFTMFVGIVIAIPFALGELLLGIEAIYIRDWKTLQIVSSLPWIILVPMIWFLLPETPRWLIAKKRYIRWIRYGHQGVS